MKLLIMLATTLLLHAHIITMTHQPIPKLSKSEKRFKDYKSYYSTDFNLGWKVNYFDVVYFNTQPSDGKYFMLVKNAELKEIFHIGKDRKIFNKTYAKYLAKAIMKPNYFWKYQQPLLNDYTFYSLRFIDSNDGNLKAIETLDEVRQFLGKIDTAEELELWLMASEHYRTRYSYKKIGKTYRVRFFDSDLGRCNFHEYFRYYNENRRVLKKKAIREIHVKGCVEVQI